MHCPGQQQPTTWANMDLHLLLPKSYMTRDSIELYNSIGPSVKLQWLRNTTIIDASYTW